MLQVCLSVSPRLCVSFYERIAIWDETWQGSIESWRLLVTRAGHVSG